MIEIIPAIIPKSAEHAEASLKQVVAHVETVQIDVVDGVFVPTTSWPYTLPADERVGEVAAVFDQFSSLRYEVDLMVAEPLEALEMWAEAGAARFIVHIESVADFSMVLDRFRALQQSYADTVLELGIALNTTTTNADVLPFVASVSVVQCMGIANIGFQGQPFDDRVIPKIHDLRERYQEAIISVDGGVSRNTAARLTAAGANRLVAGSAIFGSNDVREAIAQLQKTASHP